jgi:shikimate kinase
MGVIVLIGPKHTGKTSVGRVLAERLGRPFVDLDDCIRERSGKSPRELYIEGPEVFRAAEAEALKVLVRDQGEATASAVIAAGGGLTDNEAALSCLGIREGSGTPARPWLVYIEVSAETAWGRIAGQGGELPPFLRTENPRETHRLLHERRGADCRRIAQLTVTGDGKTPGELGAEIAEGLEFKVNLRNT